MHNQFTDRQSQSGSLGVLIQLFKTLEHKSLFFFRDTASGIRYRENSHLLFLIHRKVQGNLPAFRKFVGVGQQINDYLLHTLHIRHHPESLKRSGKQELIVRRLSWKTNRSNHLTTQLHHITFLPRQSHPVRLQTWKVENIINQTKQQIRIGFDNLIIRLLFILRATAHCQYIRKADNRVQRRPYLMTHIGKESTLQTIRLFRPVFRYTQILLRFQKLIFQTFRTEIIEKRDT